MAGARITLVYVVTEFMACGEVEAAEYEVFKVMIHTGFHRMCHEVCMYP